MSDEGDDALGPAGSPAGGTPEPTRSTRGRAGKPKRRKRRAKPPQRPDIFADFAERLKAIDWNDTIKREAAVSAVLGQLIVSVATVGELRKEERERLTWVTQLARQLKDFRDTAAIDAALKQLASANAPTADTVDGPKLEPSVVDSEYEGEASSERGARPTLRGRPRTRAFA